MAKISLACFSPKRKQQSVVLEGIQGQTHPRALGAIKADDHIRPRRRQPTPFSYPVVPKRHVELIPSVCNSYVRVARGAPKKWDNEGHSQRMGVEPADTSVRFTARLGR